MSGECEEAPSVLDALSEAFGGALDDVEYCTDDQALGDLGAAAATQGNKIVLPSSMDLNNPSADELDTLGHEAAHAAGSTSGAKDVDEEGDSAEAAAEAAGAQFAAWAKGGMTGDAPKLSGAAGGQAKTQRKSQGPSVLTGSPMLSRGSRGSLVVVLQQRLNVHGWNIGADGIFGKVTERAVKAFQRANGLYVDGIVGPKTANVLAGVTWRDREGQEESGEEMDVPIPRPRPRPDRPGTPEEEEAAPTLSGKPELSKGDRGPKVRVLQDLLSSAGFRVAVDGDFGNATDNAVRAYQRSRGLFVDGRVGPNTAEALSSNKAAVEIVPQQGSGKPLDPKDTKSFDPAGRLSDSSMNPQVARLAAQVCQELQKLGYQPYVVSGFRSFSEQNSLYEKGRSKPGPKVTWVRGGGSWHNYGLAVDIAFWNSSGSGPSWSEKHPWHLIGQVGKQVGFTRWGGDFGDRPHLEHHPGWGNKASNLASTYQSGGVSAVWKKVGL